MCGCSIIGFGVVERVGHDGIIVRGTVYLMQVVVVMWLQVLDMCVPTTGGVGGGYW